MVLNLDRAEYITVQAFLSLWPGLTEALLQLLRHPCSGEATKAPNEPLPNPADPFEYEEQISAMWESVPGRWAGDRIVFLDGFFLQPDLLTIPKLHDGQNISRMVKEFYVQVAEQAAREQEAKQGSTAQGEDE